MKKFISNNIKLLIGILIGIIISSGVVYAVNISSANVNYDNTNSGISSSNVEGALNELYEYASKKMTLNTFEDALYSQTLTTYAAGNNNTELNLTKGKYIIATLNTYTGTSTTKASDVDNNIDTTNILNCTSNNCYIQTLSSSYYTKTGTTILYNSNYLSANHRLILYIVDIKENNDTIIFTNPLDFSNAKCPMVYAIHAIPINE